MRRSGSHAPDFFRRSTRAAARFPQFADQHGYQRRPLGYVVGASGSWAIWDWGQTYGRVKQARAILQQAKITLDDAARQVELEVQQAYANMQQGRELIRSQQQTVAQAQEALRLSTARLSAGAGTQLEVLNSRVEVTRAQSISLQALFQYNAAVAEFDRVTATEIVFANALDEPRTRDKVKTDAAPTPPPKPTPLPLNNAGIREPVDARPRMYSAPEFSK
jgi:outer membrane protein TolC